MRIKVLLIGSFLSQYKGTKGVSEKLCDSDLSQFFDFKLVSKRRNQVFRLFDMILSSLVFRGNIVHIDVYSGLAFQYADIVSRIVKFRNINLIMTLRGGALPGFARSNSKKVTQVLKRADYIQSPSKYLINYFSHEGIEIQYLPNPIDLDKFPYDRSNVKPYSLLWVRAFTSIYNPEIPIYVLKELVGVFPEATLTMVGPDKGMQKEIMQLAENLGISKSVDFVGPVRNDELYRYYQTHQVFLNTTSYESFGVAVVEAAACGIPIVSNQVGEIPYLWKDNKEVLFAENNSVAKYVEQVKRIFIDPVLEESLSRNAYLVAQQFDWKKIREKWISLFSHENED
jgi:glycosyltransferase involved in cell wall biosynthesis